MSSDHQVLFVPAQFSTIQEAIDAITGPTTIMIEPGHYDESVRVVKIESLVIESTRLSRRGVTLAGGRGESVVTVSDSTLYLSGIEVRSNARRRGIAVDGSSVSLQQCIVAGNRVGEASEEGFGAGMLCRRSTIRIQKSTVAGNTIDRKTTSGAGGGLYFEDCRVEIAGSSVEVNAVYSGRDARGGGIWCRSSRMRMWRSRVTDNAVRAPVCEGGGIYLDDAIDCQIGGSVITGNGSALGRGGGIFLHGDASKVAIHANTIVRQNHPDDRCSD
jgi:hypothetical protein